ncbi:MAG: hypothetical protein LBT08_09515 [Synergistaceae bacterium]|nr:hypothetical protein [Synergistaceae bacterium]
MKTFYKLPNSYILDILESMLSIPNLTVLDVEYVTSAISIARQNSIGFADSYIAAVALDKDIGISSFNTKHFKKMGVALYSFS